MRISMSDKLKPCPFCGGKVEAFYDSNYGNEWIVICRNDNCDVDASTSFMRTKEQAVAAWNRRAEPDIGIAITDHSGDATEMINAAITLDELRGMDGEPVWCVDNRGNGKWALAHAADEVCTDADDGDWEFYCYGWTDSDVGWLAYRTKPEEENK